MLHCILFWGKDVINAFKGIKTEESEDPHHEHMAKNYKETPAWWYGIVLLASFVLGLIVVIKEDITLPVWAYVVALILGIIFGPFVSGHPDMGVCGTIYIYRHRLLLMDRALFYFRDTEMV